MKLIHKRVYRSVQSGSFPSDVLFVSVGADSTVSQSLLTQQGVPVIGLSSGKSYCFSSSLETWWETADTVRARNPQLLLIIPLMSDSYIIKSCNDKLIKWHVIKLAEWLMQCSLRTLIADKGDSLVQCADFRSCLPTHDAPASSGPLAVMQGRNLKYDSNI